MFVDLYKVLAIILILTTIDVVVNVFIEDKRSEDRKLRDTIRYLNKR